MSLKLLIVFCLFAIALAAEEHLNFFVFTDSCFHTYFTKNDFLHQQCFKTTVSKGLSLGILLGSVLLKAPVIYKMLSNKSVSGYSYLGNQVEMVGYLMSITYNFHKGHAFSQNGENIFACVQNMIIMIIFWFYARNFKFFKFSNIWFLLYLGPQLYIIWTDALPEHFYNGFIFVCMFLNFCSRIPMIYEIIKLKMTGMNSVITCFLMFAGCIARVYTTTQEITDSMVLAQHSLAAFLNFIILSLFLVYPAERKAHRD